MIIAVSIERVGAPPTTASIDVSAPAAWTAVDAREFLYDLQRLLGTGILRQGLDGDVLEVRASRCVRTLPLVLSSAAREWLSRIAFDVRSLAQAR